MKFRKCHAVVVVLAPVGHRTLGGSSRRRTDSAATTEREMIRNARGEMQEKPQYGGSINVAVAQVPTSWDPAEEIPGLGFPTYERLGMGNWASDRETCLRFVNVWFPAD